MPTEAGRMVARQTAWSAMTARNWTQGDLAEKAGADPATIGDFLAGRRWPRPATLGRIEAALGMSSGTLATLGAGASTLTTSEGAHVAGSQAAAVALSSASDEELLAELTFRLKRLQRDNTELAERARRYEASRLADQRWLATRRDDDPETGLLATRLDALNAQSAAFGLTGDEYSELEWVQRRVHALRIVDELAAKGLLEEVPDADGDRVQVPKEV